MLYFFVLIMSERKGIEDTKLNKKMMGVKVGHRPHNTSGDDLTSAFHLENDTGMGMK